MLQVMDLKDSLAPEDLESEDEDLNTMEDVTRAFLAILLYHR